jgi:hypothetical protein
MFLILLRRKKSRNLISSPGAGNGIATLGSGALPTGVLGKEKLVVFGDEE